MKNTIKVLWYIIISAMVLTMFVLVSAKVFAHGESQCFTDTDGNVRLSNDGWVKIVRHLQGDDLKGYAHGHQKQYYDKHGEPTLLSTGFFDEDGVIDDGEFYADCPTAPPPPPQPETVYEMVVVDGVPQHPDTDSPDDVNGVNNEGYNEEAEGFIGIAHTHSYINQSGVARYNKHHHKSIVIVDGVYVYENSSHHSLRVNGEGHDGKVHEPETPEPQPDPITPTPPPPPTTTTPSTTRSSSSISTSTTSVQKSLEEAKESIPEDVVVPKPPPPPPVVELVYWEYQFYKGWNFVSFSVLPEDVVTLSDLYHHWTFFAAHNAQIVVNLDSESLLYAGEGETGDIPLSPHMGLAIRLDWSTWLGVRGVRQENSPQIELDAGLNFIGFPRVTEDYRRPSDFLSDTICAVIVTQKGKFHLVGRTGDSGDDLLVDGQALALIATEPTTLYLTKSISSAPSATKQGILIESGGAMKNDSR